MSTPRSAHAAPELLPLAGGSVLLRDARAGTSREVLLRPFLLARHPLTRGQWDGAADEPMLPAHPVTWFAAISWCNAASTRDGFTPAYTVQGREVRWDPSADGYRLPTEAEWEWAARAGSTSPRYGPLEQIAWTAADAVSGPQAVGGKAANAFGLQDMIGNVWEWCWDYADTARYGEYRSLRGGGWDDPPWSARASVRRGSAPDAVLEDVGCRIARGAVAAPGITNAQGWSASADRLRASVRGPRPVGWTPLRYDGGA